MMPQAAAGNPSRSVPFRLPASLWSNAFFIGRIYVRHERGLQVNISTRGQALLPEWLVWPAWAWPSSLADKYQAGKDPRSEGALLLQARLILPSTCDPTAEF
jgi:hypothetical protein